MATAKDSPGKSQTSGAKGAGVPASAPKPTVKPPSCSVCGQAHEGTKHGGR